MRSAEEVFGDLPMEPKGGVDFSKLTWREYEHACVLKLIAWQNEILEHAATVASVTPQDWAHNIAKIIRNYKREPPEFSYGR